MTTSEKDPLRDVPHTLLEVLDLHAAQLTNKRALTFLMDGEHESTTLSFGQVRDAARTFAASLSEDLAPQSRALLLFPDGPEFIIAFLACLTAGITPVPAFRPQSRRSFRTKLHAVLADSGSRAILCRASDLAGIKDWQQDLPGGDRPKLLAFDLDATPAPSSSWQAPRIRPCDIAFLQYTSGSTGHPKGVMVSHANLIANERAIQKAFGQTKDSVIVGWLPFHHDMGLIGNILQPLFIGAHAVLMPPMAMLAKPLRWLRAIDRYRGTTSGGPNFSYDLCLRRISQEQAAGLDLSCWQVAFNGAEPIRERSLSAFAEHFAHQGFQYQAFLPCYGLAEATLFACGAARSSPPQVLAVDAAQLANHQVSTDINTRQTLLVSSGFPAENTVLNMVDPKTSKALTHGRIGEIWLAGSSITQGYWGKPGHGDFSGQLQERPQTRYLRTGDLGFIHENQLYVTGRLKELIIVNGKNHYPQDIERTLQASSPVLVSGGGAVFQSEQNGQQALVVVQEVARTALRKLDTEAVCYQIRASISDMHGLQVGEVVLIKQAGLPKTTSSKIQRLKCKQLFENQQLPTVARMAWAVASPSFEITPEIQPHSWKYLSDEQVHAQVSAYLKFICAQTLAIPAESLSENTPLGSFGLDSIAAMTLQHRIQEDLGMTLEFSQMLASSSLAKLAAYIRKQATDGKPPAYMEKTNSSRPMPLSQNQVSLWQYQQHHPESNAYNLCLPLLIEQKIDPEALAKAIEKLGEMHPLLRCYFSEHDGQPQQEVRAQPLRLIFQKQLGKSVDDLQPLLDSLMTRAFDLHEGATRFYLLQRSTQSFVFLSVVHHIVADYWSLSLLLRDLGHFYLAFQQGQSPKVVRPVNTYADFVVDQAKQDMSAGRDYWKQQLRHGQRSLALPTATLTGAPDKNAGQVFVSVSQETRQQLQALCLEHDTRLYVLLATSWLAFVHKLTQQTDISMATPFAGREKAAFAEIAGYFVNPVVVRSRLSPGQSFVAFLEQSKQSMLTAFKYGHVPLTLVAQDQDREKRLEAPGLYQMLFNFLAPQETRHGQNLALGLANQQGSFAGVQVQTCTAPTLMPMLPLVITAVDQENQLSIRMDFDQSLYETCMVAQWAASFSYLLRHLHQQQYKPVPWLKLQSQEVFLAASQAKLKPCKPQHLLLDFENTAKSYSKKTAVIHADGQEITYGQLNAFANQIANGLLAKGLSQGDRIGICLPRTHALIAAMLGVLKAGAAYVPLDIHYPTARLQRMCAASDAKWVIGQEGAFPLEDAFLDIAHLCENQPISQPASQLLPQQIAYVIFTSGSTGTPKGVTISHQAAMAMVSWAKNNFAEASQAIVLASTSICFDLSIFEIFLPLNSGGTVGLVDNLLQWPEVAFRQKVHLINTVPSVMETLLHSDAAIDGVATINLAGEPLTQGLVKRIWQKTAAKIFNLYGPSEDTTYSTFTEVTSAESPPTIGRPIDGTAAYVLDVALRPVADGGVGDIYLAGNGLSQGYLHMPKRTAETFLPNPFAPKHPQSPMAGARMYRTGDQARRDADGNLVFLGRADQQVKIRGFRIELGEIETVLRQHPHIAEVAVATQADHLGAARLVAFLVLQKGAHNDEAGFRKFLEAQLPTYCIPQLWPTLAALPLTPNGKLDRLSLPQIKPEPQATPKAPRSEMEAKIRHIWAHALGVVELSFEDNFYLLGGHSLSAARIVAQMHSQLGFAPPLRLLLENPTLIDFVQAVTAYKPGVPSHPSFCSLSDNTLSISSAQKRLWFLQKMLPLDATYHMAVAFQVTGTLNQSALENAIAQILTRHQALRMGFEENQGEPSVFLQPVIQPLPLVIQSLAPAKNAGKHALKVQRRLDDFVRQPFQLNTPPLIRILWLVHSQNQSTLAFCMHHLVGDGWSVEILMRELFTCYNAFAATSTKHPFPEPATQPGHVTAWQRQWLNSKQAKTAAQYWQKKLHNLPPLLELPTDHPRPPVKQYKGATYGFELPPELTKALSELAHTHQHTSFTMYLAVFQLLLARYCNQKDVTVGTPVANRSLPPFQSVVGLLANTLALRTQVLPHDSFIELASRVKNTVHEALDHEFYPFDQVVEAVQPERHLSHTPLFQAMFLFEEQGLAQMDMQDVTLDAYPLHNGGSKFDLTLGLGNSPGHIKGFFEYDSDLFEPATISHMAQHFLDLVREVCHQPNQPIAYLPLVSDEVGNQRLKGTARLATESCKGLYERFEFMALQDPKAPAIYAETRTLNYGELHLRAQTIAGHLAQHGAGPGTRVGILLQRDPNLIASLLACLKLGACYVPLDPAYPEARIQYMLADSQADLVICQASEHALPANCTPLLVSDLMRSQASFPVASVQNTQALPAYLIYTSGSTGQPKGVMIAHHQACAMMDWASACFQPEDLAVTLATTSICFDLSIFEIFLPLSCGAAMALAPRMDRLSAALAEKVTCINTVPSAMDALLENPPAMPRLRVVNTAGEPLRRALVTKIYQNTRAHSVYNLYGPSEDTTYSTFAYVAKEDAAEPTIGEPISGSQALVLDNFSQLQPDGILGELFLAGQGIAQGYFNQPALTAAKFLPHPFAALPGERVYATGDQVKRLTHGALAFHGRRDQQIKLRGFRIELGEIETLLNAHPGVKQAAVVRQTIAKDARLVAFISFHANHRTAIGPLRTLCTKALPAHMVPNFFVPLQTLPQTPNAKIDKKALRSMPLEASPSQATSQVADRHNLQLMAIFQELLGIEQLDSQQSFFELGGHSLLVMRALSRIEETFGCKLAPQTFFENPTIQALAAQIPQTRTGHRLEGPSPAPPQEAYLLSPTQKLVWMMHEIGQGSSYHIVGAFQLDGPLHVDAMREALDQLAQRHQALRLGFARRHDEVYQIPNAGEPPRLDCLEISGDRQHAMQEVARAPFDLAKGPLLKVVYLQNTHDEHTLVMCMHHLIADGWSLEILLNELQLYYAALQEDKPLPDLTVPELQFTDTVVWQHQQLNSGTWDPHIAYWREALQDVPTRIPLPYDVPNSQISAGQGHTIQLTWRTAVLERAKQLAEQHQLTLQMVFLTGWATCLHLLTGSESFRMGCPVANRNYPQVEPLLGYLANTLVLPCHFTGDPKPADLFQQMKTTSIEAFTHRDVPFPSLLPHLQQDSSSGMQQLFQVAFALWEHQHTRMRLGNLHLQRIHFDSETSKFDLMLFLEVHGQELTGYLEYSSQFHRETILKIAALFEKVMTFLSQAPDAPLAQFYSNHASEWAKSQMDFNRQTLQPSDPKICLLQRMRHWTKTSPRRPALVHALMTVSFAEMSAKADVIAQELLQMGVGPEVGVGLFFVRSPQQIIALLAVLKVGAYFVPLDPQYPERRLERMLSESDPSVILTHGTLEASLPATNARVLNMDRMDLETAVLEVWVDTDEQHPAYMIFTSGSLGNPRGVLVTRAAVNHLAQSLNSQIFGDEDTSLRISMNGPLAFDTSLKQWTRLAFGNTLVIIPAEMRTEPEAFLDYCCARSLQVLDVTPSHLSVLLHAGLLQKLEHLKFLLIGGEAILPDMWQMLARQTQVACFNMYGPTEVTGDATVQRITPEQSLPAIGHVLPHLGAFALQAQLWPIAAGMTGQLALCGVGLARCYANDPRHTALRFLPNPFAYQNAPQTCAPGSRLYLTGDQAGFDDQGTWRYLGRLDHQVKIRGFRIELGDIEAVLQRHPDVARAYLKLHQDHQRDPILVGYVAPTPKKNPYSLGRARYLLPNGLAIAHLNDNETRFLYREMFEEQAYYKHGISIKGGDTVFDVGSNIGLFTLSTHFRAKNLQFFCFEPGHEVCATLTANVALHDVQAEVFECGLGRKQQEKTYTYYPGFAHLSGLYADPEEELEVVRSFVAQQEGLAVQQHETAILDELILEKLKPQTETVQIKRLSDIIDAYQVTNIDLLKINVEKAEWDVFQGIASQHWALIQQVSVEIHDVRHRLQAVVNLLEDKGFHVFVEKDWSLHGSATTNYYVYARKGEARQAPAPQIPVEKPLLEQAAVKAYLGLHLPDYMVPHALVIVDTMPLTAHGKIDPSKLPAFQTAMATQTTPQTPTQEMVQAIWEEVLSTSPIGIHQDFFNIGGHSLIAVGILARIRNLFDCHLEVKTLFEAPTISGLSRAIDFHLATQVTAQSHPISPAKEATTYPLSFGQQRLWFLAQMEENREGYHLPVALRLRGGLNLPALQQAINGLMARHESLRTRFPILDGQAVQQISPDTTVPIEMLTAEGPDDHTALALLATKGSEPFNLATGPLLRVFLLEKDRDEHLLLLSMHHMVTDGWSVGILIGELSALYAEEAHGVSAKLQPPVRRYVDYAVWERETLKGLYLQSKLEVWQKLLANTPEFLDLPTDRPRPQLQSYKGSTLTFELGTRQTQAVGAFAKAHQVTPFMVYLSVYAMLLARVSGQQSFNIGTPVANRSRQEIEHTVGLFLNSLALPIHAQATSDYLTFLQKLRGDLLRAFGQADVPFELVVEALNPSRSLAYSPLFQAMFTLQNAPVSPVAIPHLELEAVQLPQSTAKFDLTLVLFEQNARMSGLVEFSTDLFDPATVARWIESYEYLLHEVLHQPNRSLSQYHILTPARRHQLLATWNATDTLYDSAHTAITRFLDHCEQRGEKTALMFPGRELSYQSLHHLALNFSYHLKAMAIQPGDRVGVYCHRCPEMVAGLLAIHYLGAAYIPLDPTYPKERIDFIMADADLKGMLTHQGYADHFTLPTLAIETCDPLPDDHHHQPLQLTPDLPAYMIYTSGSTGQPKGVVVTHRNVVNFFAAMDQSIASDQKDTHPVWLALTSISFDISVLELFWTLSRGDTIVLQPDRPLQDYAATEAHQRSLEFGLFYFASDEQKQQAGNKYRLLLEGAAFADRHEFSAVWMPERHFHAFGGTFPNPSVAAAAVAATTQKIAIRSGSVVLPLHDPIRVAEEWSMVDNLSNGRVALSIASGWQPNDFVLAPDKFENRHQVMRDAIQTLRLLWRGGQIERLNGVGKPFAVSLYPKPIQSHLPIWITAAGNPETFRYAGTIGAYVLTHLLGQDLEQLSEKIALYRKAWHKAGHPEGKSHVTLMIHTFVDDEATRVAQLVEQPFKDYLRSSINLVKTMLPDEDIDLDSEENRELLIHQAYLRFSKTHALFGTPDSLRPLILKIKAGDIDELACLIDFGIAEDHVIASLPHLAELNKLANQSQTHMPPALPYVSPAELIKEAAVTHLQCTPSMARIFLEDPQLKALLPQLQQMLVGGEALPADVAKVLLEAGVGRLYNMYGPTETTIWSSVAPVDSDVITIGRPIANTQMLVTDRLLEPQHIGTSGDLWIGGDGVTMGYWQRPGLTASRFIPNPHGAPGSRLYFTGDRAAILETANISYRGRSDDQVKLHGFRIELGEIEAHLNTMAGVQKSVAMVRTDRHADGRLVAYVVPENRLGLQRMPPEGFKSQYQQYTLPNGLEVHHHDSRQLGALYQELFADEIYLKHGLSLPPGAVVFDVGANIGGFSMFAHYQAQHARVFAFEPIPPTFALLSDNFRFHGVEGKVFNMGLSDKEETVTFTYYPHMSGLSSRFGDAEVDKELAKSLINAQMQQGNLGSGLEHTSQEEIKTFLADSYRSEQHACPLKTLSQIIQQENLERIDFLKIDVEKSECLVLRGIAPEDWAKIHQISMEIDGDEHLAEVRILLKQHGFEVAVDEFMTGTEERSGLTLKIYMLYARNSAYPQAVCKEKAPLLTKELIRAHLIQVLPEYMVPSETLFLEHLPLTPNGKVDKKALPAPEALSKSKAADYVAPRNEVESHIEAIWKAVLQKDRVGIGDNFFELGGNSLLLTHVLTQLRAALAPTLPMVTLFKYPTIATLATHLSKETSSQPQTAAKQQQRAQKRAVDRKRLANKRGRLVRSSK